MSQLTNNTEQLELLLERVNELPNAGTGSRPLPEIEANDNGKVLQVVNGAPQWAEHKMSIKTVVSSTVESSADEKGNHFITLSDVDIGTELSVGATGSKVFCYDGGNLCPALDQEATTQNLIRGADFAANGIVLTEEEQAGDNFKLDDCIMVTSSANTGVNACFIDLPFMLPPGRYYFSARLVRIPERAEGAAKTGFKAYNTQTKQWACSGVNLGDGYSQYTGRYGANYNATVPFNRIIIHTEGSTEIYEKLQLLYSDVSIGNKTQYEYRGDYCGVVYDLSSENPVVTTNPMKMLADDFAAFSASYDAETEVDIANLEFMPSITTEDNGKVLKVVNGDAVWSELSAADQIGIPDYLMAEADRVTEEVISTGLDSDLSFLVFADPHSFEEYKYLKYAKLMNDGGLDFLLGLGDYNPYGDATKADCIVGMHKVLAASGRGSNCLYVAGNHDVVVGYDSPSAVNTLTKKEQHKLLCSHLNGVAHFNENDPYGCYYYVDYEASKIRVIVLNSSDLYDGSTIVSGEYNSTIAAQKAQMDWLTGVALDFSDKPNWSVLVAVHTARIFDDSTVLYKILKAVNNGTTVTYTSDLADISADFTGKQATVIGVIYGHGHSDGVWTTETIKSIEIGTDNAYLSNYHTAPVSGVNAGSYYLTTISGTKFAYDITENYPDAAFIEYNEYFSKSSSAAVWLLDSNDNVIKTWSGTNEWSTDTYVDGMIEIAGQDDWVPRRNDTENPANSESCAIININKDTRTITIIPYGLGDQREINY